MAESHHQAAAATGAEDRPLEPLEMAPHYYGGQAIIEGVMMRGATSWAIAVRRPDDEIYVECNPVSDFTERRPIFKKPMFRGIYALGDSLSIGMKALTISAAQALEDEDEDDGKEGEGNGAALGASMAVAMVVFVGIFIVLPSAAVKAIDTYLLGGILGDAVLFHLVESLVRIAIFLAYLSAISLLADIRRVFQYHGAEHKTITAWEHGEVLEPATVDKYSTVHVRCGTNFLIMVMLIALIVYTLVGAIVPAPDGGILVAITYHVLLRVILLPVIAGLAYEGLRLGARHGDHLVVRGLMKPGLWLQKITTKQPTPDMIEVAIRAFEAVVPDEHLVGRISTSLTSPIVTGARTPGSALAPTPAPTLEPTLEPTPGPALTHEAALEPTDGA